MSEQAAKQPNSTPKRRWFRFRLRTLLIAMALVGAILAVWPRLYVYIDNRPEIWTTEIRLGHQREFIVIAFDWTNRPTTPESNGNGEPQESLSHLVIFNYEIFRIR